MKLFVAILLCCGSGTMAHTAQAVIVPNNLINAEGNSPPNDFLNEQSFRMQMVISASEFSALGSAPDVTNSLSSIWFRIDGASATAPLWGLVGRLFLSRSLPGGRII